MAGVGKAIHYSHSKVSGYHSYGSVSGYNIGVYATWLADQKNNTGAYIDGLAQYSWFNNSVEGQGKEKDNYESFGLTVSMEGCYTFNIANTERLRYFIQPNAQIAWISINQL